MSTAEFWSEEADRRRAESLPRRRPAHARALGSPMGDRSGPISVNGFAAQDAARDWSMGSGVPQWEDFGPPPLMHPDHPSAPYPAVPDDLSAPMPSVRVRTDRPVPGYDTGPHGAVNARPGAQRPPNPWTSGMRLLCSSRAN